MRILITGKGGYLGTKVSHFLQNKNIKTYTNKANLLNFKETNLFLNHIQPDCIIHCAAIVPRNKDDYLNENISKKNYKMLNNIIKSCSAHIVFTSSMTVYNFEDRKIFNENNSSKQLIGYAKGKKKSEELLFNSNLKVTILRLPGFFGQPRKAGLIYNYVKSIHSNEKFLFQEKYPLWGAIHVEDAANYCIKAALRQFGPKKLLLNAGYSDKQSVKLFFNLVNKKMKKEVLFSSTGPNFKMDVGKINYYFGKPLMSWSKRIDQVINEINNET